MRDVGRSHRSSPGPRHSAFAPAVFAPCEDTQGQEHLEWPHASCAKQSELSAFGADAAARTQQGG